MTMIKGTLLALSCALAIALCAPNLARAQASNLERQFAERTAMSAIVTRCNLLQTGPRRALMAFTAQARGGVLRAGVPDNRVQLLGRQAEAAAAKKSCADPAVVAEVSRIVAAHKGWRGTMSGAYPGLARTWQVDRSGKDAWRAVQELGAGVRAGFVRTHTGLAFAVETPEIRTMGARLYLRDPARLGPPKAGERLKPPLRAGTEAHLAAVKRPANTKQRVELPARQGSLFAFSDATTRAVLSSDPRDSFEIEIIGLNGQTSTYVVEVGDMTAAWAFAAEL